LGGLFSGLFGGKRPKPEEKKETQPVASTVSGAILPQSEDGYGEVLKGIIETAAIGQPQITEQITAQLEAYVREYIPKPFRRTYRMVLAPAVLMGDASNKELADINVELGLNRLQYALGPKAISRTLAMEYDLQYAAAQPILRLARKSHLLHVMLRYGPVILRDED